MLNIETNTNQSVFLKKAGESVDIDCSAMPMASRVHVWNYGLRQILNDAMASAKNDDEALAFAQKRLDNLMSGTLRASGGGSKGNPVRKRAQEIAEGKIALNAKFIAWVEAVKAAESDPLKVLGAKAKKLRELAVKAIEVEGNAYMAQAKIDVENAASLDDIEIEI